MDLTIPVILGTARDGAMTKHVFNFVLEHFSDRDDANFIPIKVGDYPLVSTHEAWNEHEDKPQIGRWREIAETANGFIIVAPEYNHGYPGELKIFLDSAFKEYFDKPVMLVGVSSGQFGGARMIENLTPVLVELGMKPTGRSVNFGNVGDVFDEEGELADNKREDYSDKLDKALKLLLKYADKLKGFSASK